MNNELNFEYLDELEENIFDNLSNGENNNDTENIKTFNVIANKDEILQMYLKDISKIKLLKKDL